MGKWTLLSATPDIRNRNDVYGHYFSVSFKLKYSPSKFGRFTEMPTLEWKETITMIERNKGTWWQYIGDQFQRNPNSQTFYSWVNRYNNAHYSVRMGKYGPDDVVRLYDNKGGQLKREDMPRLNSSQAQADFVREYLKKEGGIMEVIVVDKPGINKTSADQDTHKERILTFDCGLQGSDQRVKACQHLIVDGSKPEGQWFRECILHSTSRPFQTTGMKRNAPPADVSLVKSFTGGASKGSYL